MIRVNVSNEEILALFSCKEIQGVKIMCKVIEDFKISLIEYGKRVLKQLKAMINAFKEFLTAKGVEFNGILQRFYVVSYKNFLVDSNYEVVTSNKKINC
jgi:integrase/recombinase XerD